MKLLAYDFLTALRFARHAVDTKDIRSQLHGVRFDIRDGGRTVRLIGTDGHRMALVDLDLPDTAAPSAFTLHADCVDKILKIYKTSGKDVRHVEITADQLHVDGDVPVDLQYAKGLWVDTDRLTPDYDVKADGEPECGVNLKYLEAACKALKPLANPSYHGMIVKNIKAPVTCMLLEAPTNHGNFAHITKPARVVIGMMRL